MEPSPRWHSMVLLLLQTRSQKTIRMVWLLLRINIWATITQATQSSLNLKLKLLAKTNSHTGINQKPTQSSSKKKTMNFWSCSCSQLPLPSTKPGKIWKICNHQPLLKIPTTLRCCKSLKWTTASLTKCTLELKPASEASQESSLSQLSKVSSRKKNRKLSLPAHQKMVLFIALDQLRVTTKVK